ncbi:hypothetical protein CVIRNUC_010978 [Coccomyxa viridis]|uniref:Cytochrome P450 n=1 Tax=Coccomyxa viridis TaxID=1274662 RepID=A0AAV1IKA2_9CHLO|nr:hypothetical protein CVIRNUC_010978 [Coccomyxa viridis]
MTMMYGDSASLSLCRGLLLVALAVLTTRLSGIYRYIRIWLAIRRLPRPPGATLTQGHAAAYIPSAKHKFEEANSKSVGTLYRYRNYSDQIVVVSDPTLENEVFAAERDGAIEKPDQSSGFKEREMNMFSEKSGDPRWKLVRKGTAPAFAPQNMRNYHHRIVNTVDRLISAIKQKGSEVAVNIADIAQRESFDVIGKVGFGRDFAASKDIDNPVNTFQQLTDDLEESTLRQINPWRKYSLSKGKRAMDKNHEDVQRIYTELVDDCTKRPPSDEDANSIAGHLLRLRDRDGKPLSRARLIEEFAVFFIAGSETTGHTVAWTLWFLATNPAALAKLEDELNSNGLLKTVQNPGPRPFTHADIGKLHWLDCCIKEAMRLQPVVANSLRRLVVRPVRLSNGFVLPAGVHVELAQYSVMRNPAWGWEAPNTFKPERWENPEEEYYLAKHAPDLAGQGSASSAAPALQAGSKARRMHPFGQGIRNCVGQQLAKINIPTVIAMFVREFHLTLAPQMAGKGIEELEVLRATLQPKDGIYMLCKPRA